MWRKNQPPLRELKPTGMTKGAIDMIKLRYDKTEKKTFLPLKGDKHQGYFCVKRFIGGEMGYFILPSFLDKTRDKRRNAYYAIPIDRL